MKNEFILHFSAIPIARLVPPPEKGGPVTGSLRDLYTLEWGAEHPVTPAEAARLKALAKLDAVEVLSRLEEYAELYLEENGNPDYNTRFSRIALESEIPESMDYGAELTVRYQIEGLQDRTYEGKSYTLASQPGDHLSTTFTVMERNAFMGQLRVAGAMGELGG